MIAQPERDRVAEPSVPEIQLRDAPEGELHLRFYVPSGREFALPATGIKEVVIQSPQMITSVPNVSFLLLGTMNLRGQVIWVADLGQFLGEGVGVTAERSELPVIAIEQNEIMVGLAVEGIIGMDWLDAEELTQASEQLPEIMAAFVRGEWATPRTERPLRLLDPSAILRSSRWSAG
ncbi:MAG: chemotaxis protein CheW [Cyanobacteria bacterium J06641_5]